MLILAMSLSCSDEKDCEYIQINSNCDASPRLELSTGLDANGNVIPTAIGSVDPFWKIINNPKTTSCNAAVASTFNGSAFAVNLNSSSPTAWANQPNTATLSPYNTGDSSASGCVNPDNSNGDPIPYVFERSFCVLENTTIDLELDFRADNRIYLELVNNNGPTVLTSPVYTYSGPPLNWVNLGIPLTSGSYSLRAYLINEGGPTGFSIDGFIRTTNVDNALSENVQGCCENNVINVLHVIDNNCNAAYDSSDSFGDNWTIHLRDATNSIIRTAVTDINGNVFFAGLADGTYTVEIVTQTGFTTAATTYTVIVANNEVKIEEFYSCP
ncbi:SdrD B-like domain-containing protein [Lacinutrix chionoecetis]